MNRLLVFFLEYDEKPELDTYYISGSIKCLGHGCFSAALWSIFSFFKSCFISILSLFFVGFVIITALLLLFIVIDFSSFYTSFESITITNWLKKCDIWHTHYALFLFFRFFFRFFLLPKNMAPKQCFTIFVYVFKWKAKQSKRNWIQSFRDRCQMNVICLLLIVKILE